NQIQPGGVELFSDAAAKGAPQLRRVDPHREATRDSRTAHPRIGCPACGGQEARSEVGTPGSSSHGGVAQWESLGHQHPEDWVTAQVRERQIDVVRDGNSLTST